MRTVRRSLAQIRREGAGRVDRKRLNAFSDAEIERMAAEDGTVLSDDALERGQVVYPASTDAKGS
jgi:hypothetical protein